MKFYRFLSIAEKDAGNSAFLAALQKGVPDKESFLLTLPETGSHLIEILSPGKKEWRLKKDRNPSVVIGAASDRDTAVELTAELIRDCFNTTGAFDLRAYLAGKYGEVPE